MSPSTSNLETTNGSIHLKACGIRCLTPSTPSPSVVTALRGAPQPFPSPSRLSQPVPEQVCEPACRHGPQEVGQCVEIPDIKLVVEGAAKADADEVGGEENGNNL